MKLAFLGTGSAFSPERYNGAVVVDGRLLLDGGAPLLPHMKRVDVDPGAIDAVFLTHFHGDHTLGLPTFALYRIFVDPRPITFVGPDGIEERLETLWEVSWGVDWKPVMHPRFRATYQSAQPSGEAAGYKYEELVEGADVAIVEATGPGDVFSHMSWEAAAKLKKRHPKTHFLWNHLYSGTVEGAVQDLQVVEV